jgi:3-oxoacyl-[acyl-carrier protein] reductase
LKTVIITGGSSGIGAATVSAFTEANCTIISIGRQKFSPEGAPADIMDNPKGPHHKIFIDLNSIDEVQSVSEKLDALNISTVDSLINCAGIGDPSRINEMSFEAWERVMRINITAPFFLIKQLTEKLSKSNYPSIVNVSSIAGRSKSIKLGCHYSTSKAAMIGMTRHLAHELGGQQIRVNCVAPSQTTTPMLDAIMSKKEQHDLAEKNPLKRLASPDEVATVIKFLCSKESSYINGATIDINGGFL